MYAYYSRAILWEQVQRVSACLGVGGAGSWPLHADSFLLPRCLRRFMTCRFRAARTADSRQFCCGRAVQTSEQTFAGAVQDTAGQIHLALFRSDYFIPSTAIAFKASGTDFLMWKSYLENEDILLRYTDHTIAWSIYFQRPRQKHA